MVLGAKSLVVFFSTKRRKTESDLAKEKYRGQRTSQIMMHGERK